MDMEIFLGIILAFSIFFAIVAFFTALCVHSRLSDLKAEIDLQAKDFVYQSRERFTAVENRMRAKEDATCQWQLDMQMKVHALEDSLCG